MYSRPQNKDFRVPHNYSGNIFNTRQMPSTPVEDLTHKRPQPPPYQEQLTSDEHTYEDTDACNTTQNAAAAAQKNTSLLAPLGSLGTEELLLIALALIVFQGGKEPELALILLALLFIN